MAPTDPIKDKSTNSPQSSFTLFSPPKNIVLKKNLSNSPPINSPINIEKPLNTQPVNTEPEVKPVNTPSNAEAKPVNTEPEAKSVNPPSNAEVKPVNTEPKKETIAEKITNLFKPKA